MTIEQIIQKQSTTIIDVRTPAEFSGGNVAQSINIPLQELQSHLKELKEIKGDIVLCCASGGRSHMATQMLRQQGFDNVHNGGGWLEINNYKPN